jgi:hypothetical protein
MPKAGWCGQCGAYVYLTASGGCPSGHGSEWLSNLYDVPDQTAAPVAVEPAPVITPEPEVAPEPTLTLDGLIAEISELADKAITVTRVGESVMVQSDSVSGQRLVELLDRALELKPEDPALLVARSDALAHAMQLKTAEDALDEILARYPDDLEARVRKEHWGEWSSVFTLPRWSESATALTPAMRENLAQ